MDAMREDVLAADQRGLGKRLKAILPTPMIRPAVWLFNAIVGWLPYAVKYPLGTALRRSKFPYSFIRDGDFVVQIGAPRDTLAAGRSRAVHFARLVGSGRVLVMEPDPDNVTALRKVLTEHGLIGRVDIVQLGAWHSRDELVFLSSPSHPAANVLAAVNAVTPAEVEARGYREIRVPVAAPDELIAERNLPVPRLVSITTNGAEREILEGLRTTLANGCPYVSLALTPSRYDDLISELGFDRIGRDDRGFFYRSRSAAGASAAGR